MADQRKPVPMKVGANTMSFMWKTSARKALETLAREGYRCFEVMAQRPHFDPYMKRAEALAFARFLRAAGLTVETINLPSLDQNLASASPEMRDYSVRLFERLIAIAEAIGAAAVVVVTGRVNPLIAPARADLEGWFAEAFARVLRSAERAGVQLLLENIPMGVYPRADQLIRFAERVGSPRVGICYDIANAHFIGEDTAKGLAQVRRQDWAFAGEEHELAVRALAVPLRDMRGRTVAALNVVLSDVRRDAAALENELLPLLFDAAREVRALL